MPITTITVRYMRRTQPQEYQPVECELTAQVTVPEGQDALLDGVDTLNKLRHLVHQAVGALPAQVVGLIGGWAALEHPQTSHEPPAQTFVDDGADRPDVVNTPAAAGPWDVADKQAAPTAPSPADPWDVAEVPAKPAAEPAAAPEAPKLALEDVRAAAARMAERQTPAAVRALISGYNVAQLADLPKGKWQSFITKADAT